jgi:hypothetical protein
MKANKTTLQIAATNSKKGLKKTFKQAKVVSMACKKSHSA